MRKLHFVWLCCCILFVIKLFAQSTAELWTRSFVVSAGGVLLCGGAIFLSVGIVKQVRYYK